MPLNLRARIKKLAAEQSDEASQPVSYAILKSDGEEQEEIEQPGEQEGEVPESLDAPPPDSPPEDTATEAPPEDVEPPPDAEPMPEPEPEDVTAPDDWEPVEADEPVEPSGPDAELEVPESEDAAVADEQPDWESMLGFVGQQANEQLFDGIAIRLAESTHRTINRTQDRFEQHMAELDIGNSY